MSLLVNKNYDFFTFKITLLPVITFVARKGLFFLNFKINKSI